MNRRILCVDDDANILAAYQRTLRKQYTIDTALGGEEALRKLAAPERYAVIVADMQMPGMNGIELLMRTRELVPDTVRIMLTGNADQKTAVAAVNDGHVYRFLNKPCPPEVLALALEAGVEQYARVTAERELLEKTLKGSITVLIEILSLQNPEAFGRCQEIRDLIRPFGNVLGLRNVWEIELAAMLSQIGLVTLPATLLRKAREGGPLSSAEEELLARVPEIGADLLRHIPRLETVAAIVRHQNQPYRGMVADDAVNPESIPAGARLLKFLQDLKHLERRGASRAEALQVLRSRNGVYDPRVLDAAAVCFHFDLQPASPVKSLCRPTRVRDLKPGEVLAANVETLDGLLVITIGAVLTPLLIEKIKNFARLSGVKEPIYVES